MSEYTIVDPGFEFIPPPEPGKELEFLELATRTCYKSEGHIKPGSAEKLLTKVVKGYEHLSVTEHANCVIKITRSRDLLSWDHIAQIIVDANPLFASRISFDWHNRMNKKPGVCTGIIVSGNIRMFIDALKPAAYSILGPAVHKKWPFFFEKPERQRVDYKLLDENPTTNKDRLHPESMLKHMTLTYRIIGDRSMSHQLVRHRLCAFSQESQRYCNYGKKGFQIVVPPSATEDPACESKFINEAIYAYRAYRRLLDAGMKPEDARGLLPNCTKTEVVTTCTLENWKHIFEHRANNPKAQWQIRGIMQGIQAHMKGLVPEVF